MQSSVRFLSTLIFGSGLLFGGSAGSTPPLPDTEEKLFKWCMSHFPDEDGRLTLLPRPVQKLAPLVMEDVVAPTNLVTKTQITGKLPPDIDKYRGFWIWPSVEENPFAAVFVERLTSSEMTLVLAHKHEKDQDEEDYADQRLKLTWTGAGFSYKSSSHEVEIRVSQSGHAMFMMHGFILEGTVGEAWPACFIASKHY